MDKFEIIEKIHDGIHVQMATWPSPMSKLMMRTSHPDVVRNEADWISYNSDAEQAKFKRMKMSATAEQQKLAEQVMDWMTYASRRAPIHQKKVIKAIVSLRCLRMNDSSYGFRELAKQLSWMGIKMSHMTVKRRFDLAIDDLWHHLNRS